jgi:hypothetical protein
MQTRFLVWGHLTFRFTFYSGKYGSTLKKGPSVINHYSGKTGLLEKILIFISILEILPNSRLYLIPN